MIRKFIYGYGILLIMGIFIGFWLDEPDILIYKEEELKCEEMGGYFRASPWAVDETESGVATKGECIKESELLYEVD